MADTSARMLELLSLLQSPREWPGPELSDRLEVSARTLRRDIDRLRELGYRIATIKGPYGGYRLEAGSELPPLLFDDAQAVAVAVALQSAPVTGVDLEDAAASALATVRQVMPARLRHRIDRIEFSRAADGERVDPAVLEAAMEAVRERRAMRFTYGGAAVGGHGAAGVGGGRSPEGRTPLRHAEPHAVVARHGRWYLLAWDLGRGDWRTFRLDRLIPRSQLGARFAPREIPGGDAATMLAARFKGSATDDRWPCIGEVIVELPVAELRPWVADGELEPISAHSSRVRIGAWSWAGVVARLIQFDAPFEITGPPELTAAAASVAVRLAG